MEGKDLDYKHKKINIEGRKIQTYIIGKGKNVVLALPGFPHSGIYYSWIFRGQDLSKLKIISFDYPGWIGNSEGKVRDGEYSLEEFVRIAKKVLEYYYVKKLHLIGNSFGGSVATRLAYDWKKRVKKVVLISAVLSGSRFEKQVYYIYARTLKLINAGWLIRLYVNLRYQEYKREVIKQGLDGRFIKRYSELFKGMSNKVLLESIYDLFRRDWTEYLDKVKNKRFLVINSKNENILFKKQARIIRLHLNKEKSIFLEGSHEEFALKPDKKIVEKVVKFLSR